MPKRRPLLPVARVLAWADAHKRRTGHWPTLNSGPVEGAEDETWYNVNAALRDGWRGLPGGDSLHRLLVRRRGLRPESRCPALTTKQILRWADAFRARRGRWPVATSGPVCEGDADTWSKIDQALRHGFRGLPGGDSLARLLQRERGVRNVHGLPPLTEALILKWAKAHRKRTGRWPGWGSGPVEGAPGEVWANLDHALQLGRRLQLPGDVPQLVPADGPRQRHGFPSRPSSRPVAGQASRSERPRSPERRPADGVGAEAGAGGACVTFLVQSLRGRPLPQPGRSFPEPP